MNMLEKVYQVGLDFLGVVCFMFFFFFLYF